jgi:Rhs element Vgr protein
MTASSRLIPTVAPPTAVSFTVTSDGEDLGPGLPVLSIVIDREVNRIPSATLILQDGSLADQTFKLSESGDFDPGKKIELSLGYQGTNQPIFAGVITGQRIKLSGDRTLLTVTCKDAAFRMTVKRQTRYFSDQSDTDALEGLIRGAGLTAEAADTGAIVPELTQHLCTDWDFLVSRAEANGMVVIVNDGSINVMKPELADTPTLKLEYGANLMAFDAEVDARKQYAEVESHGWRAAEQEVVTEGNPPPAPAAGDYTTEKLAKVHEQSPYKQVHGGAVEPAELISWSTATARFSELSRVRGTMRFQGSSEVAVGDTVTLDKLGAVYNGSAYVSGLRHELSAGKWTTTAQLGLSSERFTERFTVSAPAAGGLLPATSGLHVATVVQMHDDPAGEERILISLPATAPEGAGNWARLATGLGGNGAGLTFRPAVGDEVVVGFLHADPRYPVILGSLHGSATPAPFAPTEENTQTGYLSRGGLQLAFDDNDESVLLETPSGDSLQLIGKEGTITLKDQNGNKVELSSSGITIESASDLTLKATGSVKIDGSSVEIKSSSTGKFEAGATLTLKGSLVQIN